jgi:hypothetical protein
MKTFPITFAQAMHDAAFVQLNGIVFEARYIRVPDDDVMELKLGDTELAFTRDEIDGAKYLDEGVYRLKSGALLRFLAPATIH